MSLTLQQRIPKIAIFTKAAAVPGAVSALLAILTPRHFEAGEVIYNEGDSGDELYVLHHGQVKVQKRTDTGGMYSVVHLDEGQHSFFGEAALVESGKRSASAIAETPCECFVMTKDDFKNLGDDQPRIGLLITREIASRIASLLHKASQDISTLYAAVTSEGEGDKMRDTRSKPKSFLR
ncbi:MAG: cyclic nucleotide-binding domain-containing protein [Myxococcota bacterium]|jgi:CRP-like cAMP-binding protein|nr:cyclic nucleotide-binding domain-containing protein [Myxococcota bacterium]